MFLTDLNSRKDFTLFSKVLSDCFILIESQLVYPFKSLDKDSLIDTLFEWISKIYGSKNKSTILSIFITEQWTHNNVYLEGVLYELKFQESLYFRKRVLQSTLHWFYFQNTFRLSLFQYLFPVFLFSNISWNNSMIE